MPVSFDRINAREFRHRCFIFTQLKTLAKSKPGHRITGLKKAVEGGVSRVSNPPAGDPKMLFVIAHRMDTTGYSRKVRYTTLFSLSAKFYIFQADPAKDESFDIVMCAKLTMQQFNNFVTSFANDANAQFGSQDARMNEVADRIKASEHMPTGAPINPVDFPSSNGQQMMSGVNASTSTYGNTPRRVGGQRGFVQAIEQVCSGAAEEIYMG